MAELPRLLDAGELASSLGQSRKWIYRQHEQGLPALKFGRSLLFDPAEVRAWLDSKRVVPSNGNGPVVSGAAPERNYQ